MGESLRSKNWNVHVRDVEQMAASPGFVELREKVLERAHLSSDECVLDIGAGTGLLALAAAPHAERVIALDSSQAMCACLADKFTRLGIPNAEAVCATATALPIADRSVDVVLSNYCFHHLTDEDKLRVLHEVRRVLRPGGRLVFADMMFSFGPLARRNREVIALVAGRMIRRGWSGVLRLCKNAIRVLVGRGEHPASAAWWQEALMEAGFADIQVAVLAHEGGIASAKAPDGIDQPIFAPLRTSPPSDASKRGSIRPLPSSGPQGERERDLCRASRLSCMSAAGGFEAARSRKQRERT